MKNIIKHAVIFSLISLTAFAKKDNKANKDITKTGNKVNYRLNKQENNTQSILNKEIKKKDKFKRDKNKKYSSSPEIQLY